MTAVPSTHWVWDPRFDDRQNSSRSSERGKSLVFGKEEEEAILEFQRFIVSIVSQFIASRISLIL